MKEYFLQSDAPWDVPSIESDPQEFVDEEQINEGFEPANDAFSGLREAGDWLFDMISDFFTQIFSGFT